MSVKFHVEIPAKFSETDILKPLGENKAGLARNLFCCGGPNPEQNKRAIKIFDKYLQQEYGKVVAPAALAKANVNLAETLSYGKPLLLSDAKKVMEEAGQIKVRIPQIKTMLDSIDYYKLHLTMQKIDHDLPPTLRGTDKRNSAFNLEGGKLLIRKRNGTLEEFKEDRIQNELQEIPLSRPLSEDQIKKYLQLIKNELRADQLVELSPKTVRLAILKTISKDNEIKKPAFLDQAPPNLMKHTQIEDLTQEEFTFLLNAATEMNDSTRSRYSFVEQ